MAVSILVTDDSKLQRGLVMARLSAAFPDREFAFTEAATGEEALEKLRGAAFDLVFLDLTMPGVTGYDVLTTLRDERVEARVIVVSADVQPMAVRRVTELGAVAHLQKPFDGDEAKKTILQKGLL